jgi:hypothetical protein
MDWRLAREGFRDELTKIGELNLSGLSAETLMSYPQPEPMPSAAYEKAQAILAKVGPIKTEGVVKTSQFRPDMLPQYKRLARRKAGDPPPDKIDTALGYGGNILAGTGAAKFTGDAVDKVREAVTGKTFSTKTKAIILGAGAAAGLANKLRKEHRRKKWQEGHHT